MSVLSDATLAHLRRVADWPDTSGTKYELVDLIGRGGMASVYRAVDRELDREVALKVIDTLAMDARAPERMLREARIIARLEHPGIVPVHDRGTLPDGRMFYTMKLVRGRRLDQEPAALGALADRLRIFERVCEAVAFAHEHGVVHRDLKPANIMLGAFGEVLVLDWGVAKVLGADAAEPPVPTATAVAAPASGPAATACGTVVGTPGYMAPEQERGEVDRIDARTDVYALGAILEFLVWADGEGGFPVPLAAICKKAKAAEPAARYAQARDLRDEVARFLAGRRVEAHPEGITGAARRLAKKYRTALVLILAYLVMRLLMLMFAKA